MQRSLLIKGGGTYWAIHFKKLELRHSVVQKEKIYSLAQHNLVSFRSLMNLQISETYSFCQRRNSCWHL